MLRMNNLVKSFDAVEVLHNVNLQVQTGEIMCLLGPSGCGKTTLLRLIAGLEQLDAGQIVADDQTLQDVPSHERGFGLMFQDFALFPHMDVLENVAFGLKMGRMPRQQYLERAREVLALVGLAGFEKRDVAQLSGGEKQRVALARSLAPNPRLLMLDEPLGSLDAALRERLAVELRAIIKQVGLTAIYVTHDRHEAYAIADRIAIMNAGHIEQVDTPEALYTHPRSAFAAQFLGLNNILDVTRYENGRAFTPLGRFSVTGQPDALLLHPDGLHLVSEAQSVISGVVCERVFLGGRYRLCVRHASGVELTLHVSTFHNHIPRLNAPVFLHVDDAFIVPINLKT